MADVAGQCSHICPVSDAIRARGPYGFGLYISANSVLASRTGSEVGAAFSPRVTKIRWNNKEYAIVMDGIIYNYREIRKQLESFGCRFSENTFSELAGYGYAVWDTALFERLNGVFALAIWVSDDKKLVLARDHVGAKPLFYSFLGNTMVFASEIRGITSHPLFRAEIDAEGLSELICLSPMNTPGSTAIKGIRELRPAHYLTYSPEGTSVSRYWKIEEKEHTDSPEETARRIRELIIGSVLNQASDDFPVCGLLSGGLYSSMITAIICREGKTPPGRIYNTWSVEYERSSRFASVSFRSDSDIPWIRWICRELGTRHHYIILSAEDLLETLSEASDAVITPGTGDHDSALMLLFREVRKEFPVVISGKCSDELFGCDTLGAEGPSPGMIPWNFGVQDRISVLKAEIVEWIRPYEYMNKRYEEAVLDYPRFAANATGLRKDYEREWFSLYWLLPSVLGRLDRASMSYSLQTRVPLCDHRLIEYLWNVPLEMKRLSGADRGILVKAAQGLVPREILERKKRPFPRPVDPLYSEKIRNMLKETVYDNESVLRYLLDLKTLESMMRIQDERKLATSYHQLFLWLIQLNRFLRSFNIRVL